MRRLNQLVRLAVVGVLIMVLTPIWAVDRAVANVRTRGRGRTESIPRSSLTAAGGLEAIMAAERPMIITDLYEQLDLDIAPDLDGLRTVAPETPFPVNRHLAEAPYFLYVGDYGATRERVDQRTMGPFLDELFGDGVGLELTTYKLFAIHELDGGIGRIIEDMAAALERLVGRKAEPKASGIWIGAEGCTTPLHHDAWTGLLFQPVGSKSIVMYGPRDRANIYFSSPFKPLSTWSRLPARSRDADPARFPRLERAVRFEGRLGEGETLFIPAFWAHEIEALEPNVSIPFRFATRPADHLDPGFLRPAVEIFNGKLTALRR
ncbi:MAG: cupin-like domain-containing protein [Actinomycetota bacterium]